VYLGFTTTLSLAVGLRLRRMAAEQVLRESAPPGHRESVATSGSSAVAPRGRASTLARRTGTAAGRSTGPDTRDHLGEALRCMQLTAVITLTMVLVTIIHEVVRAISGFSLEIHAFHMVFMDIVRTVLSMAISHLCRPASRPRSSGSAGSAETVPVPGQPQQNDDAVMGAAAKATPALPSSSAVPKPTPVHSPTRRAPVPDRDNSESAREAPVPPLLRLSDVDLDQSTNST
jgi:hypothetical protein